MYLQTFCFNFEKFILHIVNSKNFVINFNIYIYYIKKRWNILDVSKP